MGNRLLLAPLLYVACACSATPDAVPYAELDYIGSSTVANFLRDAEPVYGRVRFRFDTEPESAGGERAVLDRRGDLAGIAGRPRAQTLNTGVQAAEIGRDAIAVLVHPSNPVRGLTSEQLGDVFTGRATSWRDFGGPDVEIHALIVGPDSATRNVFRSSILGTEDYASCEVVRPDGNMRARVASDPGAIGQLSRSFLGDGGDVKVLAVDGESPTVTNLDYPIARPLFLLWRAGNPAVDAFVQWALCDEGQRVVMRRFVGRRIVGAVRSTTTANETGTLVVYTETYPYYDGGIYYYPHRSYEILARDGSRLRRVPNRRGENDETPMRVQLAPGTYLVRVESESGGSPEFFVTIEAGRRTELDVPALLEPHR